MSQYRLIIYLDLKIPAAGPGDNNCLAVGDLPVLEADLLPEVARHLVLSLHRLRAHSRTSRDFVTLSSAIYQVNPLPLAINIVNL